MKIIIEGSTLFTKGYTGIPHYILCLNKALNNYSNYKIHLGFNIKRIKKKKYLTPEVTKIPYLWYFKNTILNIRNQKPDISHSLHSPFLTIKNTKKVATIHDLAVHLPLFEEYDFANEYFKNKRMKLFAEFAKNADAIIAVSENTKQDFLSFFNYPPEKIHVIPLAPVFKPQLSPIKNSHIILNQFHLEPKKFMLSVGGVSLRKNSFNLLKAFAESNHADNHKLVFAGKINSNEGEKLNIYISKNNLQDRVVFTNYISDDDLHILYQNASSFLFPTYYEGFGIPIIEAMMYKLPILTSNIGAAPEVANQHALLVDPFDIKSITNGINNIFNKTDIELKEAFDYANQFTWDNVAKQTIKVYETII